MYSLRECVHGILRTIWQVDWTCPHDRAKSLIPSPGFEPLILRTVIEHATKYANELAIWPPYYASFKTTSFNPTWVCRNRSRTYYEAATRPLSHCEQVNFIKIFNMFWSEIFFVVNHQQRMPDIHSFFYPKRSKSCERLSRTPTFYLKTDTPPTTNITSVHQSMFSWLPKLTSKQKKF
jgi:hypothetical protein